MTADKFLAQFGARVARRRAELGITQAKVAAELGVDRCQIANVEAGRTGIVVSRLPALCRVLRVSADHLIGRKEKR